MKGRRRSRRPCLFWCAPRTWDDRFPAVAGLDSHHQSHRIPAPDVSARDARTVRAHERRASLAFHDRSPSSEELLAARSAAGRSLARSLALRPRLTTGLPWAIICVRTKVPLCAHCRPSSPRFRYPSSTSRHSCSGELPRGTAAAGAPGRGSAVQARRGRARCDRVDGRPTRASRTTITIADADPDQHVADAEDVGERHPRGQGEDVGQRRQHGSGTIVLLE